MVSPYSIDGQSTQDPAQAKPQPVRREEAMEDEEKILANRSDANIPALLTRDVMGG